MRYDARCDQCGLTDEIEKPMSAPMPTCRRCGGQTRRVYATASPVHFRAAGFYATDVRHLERQVGKERAAQVEHYRDDVERRAKAGRLTPQERALEAATKAHP